MERLDFLKKTVGIGTISFAAANLINTIRAAVIERSRQNIILIMTDNHGAWTLVCYGNPDIKTPRFLSTLPQSVIDLKRMILYNDNLVVLYKHRI